MSGSNCDWIPPPLECALKSGEEMSCQSHMNVFLLEVFILRNHVIREMACMLTAQQNGGFVPVAEVHHELSGSPPGMCMHIGSSLTICTWCGVLAVKGAEPFNYSDAEPTEMIRKISSQPQRDQDLPIQHVGIEL